MAGIMFERKERRKNIFLHSLADHPTKGKTDDAVIKYIDNSRRCIVEWGFAYFSRRDYLIYQLHSKHAQETFLCGTHGFERSIRE